MYVDKVPFQLHNMNILTDEMKENLEVEHNNRFAKARKLLDVITCIYDFLHVVDRSRTLRSGKAVTRKFKRKWE